MCRNIRVLHHFQPPTTEAEIRDAALQFVRKVSGLNAPSQVDREAFERAVAEVAASTSKLLGGLAVKGPVRTREGEREKARIRFARREGRAVSGAAAGAGAAGAGAGKGEVEVDSEAEMD